MGEVELDGKADVYSLGVMLYEILCGQLPFRSDLAAEVMVMHVRQAPRPPREIDPSVPPELEALVLAMLAKAKGERPTMAQVSDALRAVLEAAKVSASEPAVAGDVFDPSGLAPAELLPSTASWEGEEEEHTEVSVLAASQGAKELGARAGLAERRDAPPPGPAQGDLGAHDANEATVTHAPAMAPLSQDATTPGAPALVLPPGALDLAATVAHSVVPDPPRPGGLSDTHESLAPAESLGAGGGLRQALARRRMLLPVGLGAVAAIVVLIIGLSRGPAPSGGTVIERSGAGEVAGRGEIRGAATGAAAGAAAGAAQAAAPVPAPRPEPPVCAITSAPEGAEVLRAADRALLGQTPLRVERPPGASSLDVIVRRKGYADQRVALSFGADCRRQVALAPLPRAPGRRNDRAGRPARPAPGGSSVPIPIIH